MQSKLDINDVSVLDLEFDEKIECNVLGEKLFQNRKLYEISKEELNEFMYLYNKNKAYLKGYSEFVQKMINDLSLDDIDKHSFEILDISKALWNEDHRISPNVEQILMQTIFKEQCKFNDEQTIDVTCKKYVMLISEYIKCFSRSGGRLTHNVLIAIKDLQFDYLMQIKEAIEAGKTQEVINGLTDEKSLKLLADEEIYKIFEEAGVEITQILVNGTVTSQSILESAKKG